MDSDLTFIKLLLLLILSKCNTTQCFFTQYFRHTATMEVLQTLLVVAACLVMTADSVMFYLEANARKCLAEEIRQNILVTGEFEVSEMAGQQVVTITKLPSLHQILTLLYSVKSLIFCEIFCEILHC